MTKHNKNKPSSVTLVSEQYAPDLSSTAFLFEELMIELRRQGVAISVRTLTPGYHGYVKEEKIAWRETRKGVPVRRLPRLPFNRSNRAVSRSTEKLEASAVGVQEVEANKRMISSPS